MRGGLIAVAFAAFAALGASYLGALHPAGDSLAVIRGPLVALAFGLAVLLAGWRPAGPVLIALSLVAAVDWAAPRLWRPAPGGDLIVYQKNLLYQQTDRRAFVADVVASGADIVTLQEVSRANRPVLFDLAAHYPYVQVCRGGPVGDTALLSRAPMARGWCGLHQGIALAEIEHEAGLIRAASLHVGWPWPWPQASHLSNLLPEFAAATEARLTVVGADMNTVAEAHAIRRVERAAGAGRIGHVERSFAYRGYPLGIDHVFATGGTGSIEIRPLLGSDHHGVLARIALPGG